MAVELTKEIWDCPGEAHNMDMRFNPSSQGPYGDGFHHCDLCENEGLVSYRVYKEEIAYQEYMVVWREKQRIKRLEEREQQKTIDAIMSAPRVNVPGVDNV